MRVAARECQLIRELYRILFIINCIANYYKAIIFKIIATCTSYNGGCGMMAIQMLKNSYYI